MKAKKIVAVLLVVALISSLTLCLVSCDDEDETKDKAIIYVTALFSGGLYNQTTGEEVWDPIDASLDMDALMSGVVDDETVSDVASTLLGGDQDLIALLADALSYEPGTLLYDLTLDQDGNPYNEDIVPANGYPTDENGDVLECAYGVFAIYKSFIDGISEQYGDEYDVQVFNQDWRLSPAVSAQRLEEYINAKGYKEVILMSHSMGGPVVNAYLARSQANRDKVSLYMGFAPATLGSFDALAALCCLDTYVANMVSGMGDASITGMVKGAVNSVLSGDTKDFIINNIGLITLIPSYQLLASQQYPDGEGGLGVIKKGETEVTYLKEKEEIYDFYESLDWAYYMTKTYNEETEEYESEKTIAKTGEYANKDGYKIKESVATLADYYDSLFVDGKLACDSVNSYYFVGTGVTSTITGMIYDENTEEWEIITGANNEYYTDTTYYGDGTVPFYASIGGNTADVADLIAKGRIIEYNGSNHGAVGGSYTLLKEKVLELIASVQ